MKSNTLRLSHTEIVQIEADKLKLAELNGSLKEELNLARAEIRSLSVIATIVMPNICMQKDRLVVQHQATLEKVLQWL